MVVSRGRHIPFGRVIMYAFLILLALFVLAVTFVTESGGGSSATIAQVSLHTLRTAPQAYEGQLVATEGVLGFSQEHQLFQITDQTSIAVIIRGYADEEQMRSLEGQRVRVTGRFGFDEETGVYIEVAVLRKAVEE